jgi:hypothetical protein
MAEKKNEQKKVLNETLEEENLSGKPLSEDEWVKGVDKPKHKAKIPERVDVGVDMSEEDVLKYDQDGKNLFFDGELGKFRELSDETLAKLSNLNRVRYFSSLGEYTYNKKREHEPKIAERVKVSPRYATATKRLEVFNKNPDKHYVWKRTDEIRSAEYEGYQRSFDDSLDTFGSDVGSAHTVGADGHTELVLMETSQENYQKRQRAISEKSKRRIEAVENTAKEEMRRDGGLPYEAEGQGGPNFTPAVPGNKEDR